MPTHQCLRQVRESALPRISCSTVAPTPSLGNTVKLALKVWVLENQPCRRESQRTGPTPCSLLQGLN